MKKLKVFLSFVFALVIMCLGFSFAPNNLGKDKAYAISYTTNEIVDIINAGECVEKGGAIYLSAGSTYNMSGGEMSGHFAEKGGALYISDGAVFTMTGGTITGNYAKYGGAIYVASGGECYINGGTITGNYGMNAPAIYVETGGILQVSSTALVDGNIFLAKTTPINIYVDGTLSKTIEGSGKSYSLNEADMPLDYEHCCGYFLDSELRTTIKNDTIDLTSVGEEITFAPRTATASSEGVNIYTRTANPESDFSFTYDSSTQTYKIGLSNKDVEGIVVLPKEYDNVQTSIDYYGSDEMSYFEFNNEVNLCLQSGVLIIPEQAFLGVANLKSITIPDSVTSIGDYAFYYCDGLTSVIIPDSVTNIGYSAFHSCDGLTSVTIGDSVTSIGDDAFYYCDGLISITIGDNVTSIGNSVFYGCSGLTSVIIPDSVTSIGRYAFYGCSGLTGSLIMPDSVTSIGNFAFNGCSGLTGSLIMPDSVTSIGSAAFEYCSGLTSVIIPNSVKSIGNEAFSSCSGLASVYIPSSVATISASSDYSAPFNGCSSSLVIYTDVANASSKPSGWGTYWNYYDSGKQLEVVYGCSLDNEGNIVVPPATINFYVDDVYHSSITKPRTNYTVVESDMPLDYESCCGYFLDDIYMTTIKNNTINLLSGEVNLYTRTARVPTGTTFVEGTNNDYYINFPISANTEPMFAPKTKTLIYATNNVVIPKYYNGKPVTKSNSVSSRAFKIGGTVTLNDEFTEIVDMAFARGEIAASITGITIPDTVTRIGKGAFTRCGYMGNVIIPNVNLTIDESAFYECSAVESFYIPSSVSIIAPSVMENVPFYLCSSAIIYTDVANSSSIPSSWDTYWNYYDTNAQLTVMYGYTLEMYLQEISSSATVIDNNITDENKIQICKKMTINNPLSAEFIGSELGERKYDNIELSSVIGDNQTENSYLNEVILEKKECYILPKKQVVA